MKYFTALITTFLIFSFSLPGLHAQDDYKERIKRISSIQDDTRILEKVLQEMFKTKWESEENKIQIVSGSFFFGKNYGIKGMYIEDYGVIFTIPGPNSGFIVNIDGEKNKYVFENGSDSEDKEVTKETVINRITEFLNDYGSTIDQLKTDERVTVIFNEKPSNNYNFISIGSSKEDQKEKQRLPSIYVSATKKDLERVRRGSINKSQFNERLEIEPIDNNTKKRDLKIMAKILKTLFEEPRNDLFKIYGEVNHTYIKNMGALFYLDTSFGSTFFTIGKAALTGKNLSSIDFHSLRTTFDSLNKTPLKFDSLKITPLNVDSLKTKFLKLDNLSVNTFNFSGDENEEKPTKEERKEAFQQFMQEFKETIVDYGRTLKSVQSDELVFVRVFFPSSGSEPSKKVNMQIKKSVLEAYDNGNMSREEAIAQVKSYVISRFGDSARSYSIPNVSVQN